MINIRFVFANRRARNRSAARADSDSNTCSKCRGLKAGYLVSSMRTMTSRRHRDCSETVSISGDVSETTSVSGLSRWLSGTSLRSHLKTHNQQYTGVSRSDNIDRRKSINHGQSHLLTLCLRALGNYLDSVRIFFHETSDKRGSAQSRGVVVFRYSIYWRVLLATPNVCKAIYIFRYRLRIYICSIARKDTRKNEHCVVYCDDNLTLLEVSRVHRTTRPDST